MKDKTVIEKATDLVGSMAKLIKAAKCYRCIHCFEPKPKVSRFKKGGVVNICSDEVVFPREELDKLIKKIQRKVS